MQLFYNTTLSTSSTELSFDRTESRHIVKVLRKKEGDLLYITNGKNLLFKAIIRSANNNKCTADIQKIIPQNSQRDYKVQIAIAPTKNITRFEWFLEKATEIGVDIINPISCTHSERRVIKQERLEKVIQSAMKQSLQYSLPELHQLTSFNELISLQTKGQKFIAIGEDESDGTKNENMQSLIKKGTDVCILIGPEGGFSPDEIQKAKDYGFIPVSLGSTRLRTETAGLVAVQTVNLVNE